MPYYIYRVFPFRRLEKIDAAESFGDASTRAKTLRADPALPPDCTIKVVFAATENAAEDLLTQVRTPAPGVVGDE